MDESRALITAREDLKAVFATEAGKRVLKRLTAVVHPLDHAPIENPILSAHHHGRAEVLAFLWKYSYAAESPNSESEKQTT